MEYTCEWCGYTGKENEFLSGSCPACCRDNFTGEGEGIPLVFHDAAYKSKKKNSRSRREIKRAWAYNE